MSSAISIDTGGAVQLAHPLQPLGPMAGARARSRWWVEALAVAWLCLIYDGLTNLAPLHLGAALSHAEHLLRIEQMVHFAPERALDGWLAVHHTLGVLLANYYDNAHFVVTLGLLGWIWWRRSDVYRPLRNSLVLVNLLAFIVFWLYPVAPPRMLNGFTDIVATSHAFGSWHSGSLGSHADELAAMPSLHIAWAVWCAIALWRISPRRSVRVLAVLYPCLTSFAVLATGNHFVLDILGGVLVMLLSGAILAVVKSQPVSARLPRLRMGRRPRPRASA